MTVAIMLWEDTHADAEIEVFATPELAIARAKELAQEYGEDRDLDEELTKGMREAGWLYHACYGEANYIRVELKEVEGL